VVLKSGDTYTGRILEETSKYIRLRIDSKVLRIRRSAIANITLSEQAQEIPAVVVETPGGPSAGEPERPGPESYASVGLSIPAGPDEFTDYWDLGYNFGGGLGLPLNQSFSIVGYVEYNALGLDEDAYIGSAYPYINSVDGGDVSIFILSGNVKASLVPAPSTIRPYFSGGIGRLRLLA
jgi:hypothetical protein